MTDLVLETCSDERYSCYAVKSCYGGVEQLWVVFCSVEIKKKEEETFDEKILKEFEAAEKSFKSFLIRLSQNSDYFYNWVVNNIGFKNMTT